MKQHLKKSVLILGSILSVLACRSENENHDQEKPIIVSNYAENFPTSCATIKRGESFTFKAQFTDNVELGSYNVEIHHNFDKHKHDTEIASCPNEDPKRTEKPTNPFKFNESYSIPSGRQSFSVSHKIEVPANVDTGDYHFHLKVVDKAGFHSIKAVSIKIID